MRRAAAIVLLAIASLHCGAGRHRPPAEPVAPPPAPVVTPPAPVVPPPPPSAFARLAAEAREAIAAGDLAAGATRLEDALAQGGPGEEGWGWVLLDLALLHSDPASPVHDPAAAGKDLARLAREGAGTPPAAIGEVVSRLLESGQAAARGRAEAQAEADELGRRLAEARALLERREQELGKIKAILLGETTPP